ncbi:MAG: carotenoid biosynthesis protein [Acidobacteriota bacterium]
MNALSIFDAQLRSFSLSQRILSWMAIFPLSAALLAFVVHVRKKCKCGKRRYLLVASFFFIFFLVLLGIILLRRNVPYKEIDVKLWFEISTGLAFLFYLLHCLYYEGMDASFALFVVGLLYGGILENGGILLGFFKEEGFHVYLPFLPAPLFTTLGWCNVFYSCRFLAGQLFKEERDRLDNCERTGEWSRWLEPFSFALTLTVFALFLDLQLDPYATHHGLWIWNEGLNPFLGGVPLVNFTAWVSAVFPFALVFRLLERNRKEKDGILSIHLLIRMPLIILLAVLMVLSIIFLLEGYDSPAMRILLQYTP